LNDGYDPEAIKLLVEPEFRSDEAIASSTPPNLVQDFLWEKLED
jgi:hypothetical protein